MLDVTRMTVWFFGSWVLRALSFFKCFSLCSSWYSGSKHFITPTACLISKYFNVCFVVRAFFLPVCQGILLHLWKTIMQASLFINSYFLTVRCSWKVNLGYWRWQMTSTWCWDTWVFIERDIILIFISTNIFTIERVSNDCLFYVLPSICCPDGVFIFVCLTMQ